MTQENFSYDFALVSAELCIRPEVLKRLVVSFGKTIATKTHALEAALADNDIVKARAVLHEVRGTSGNLRLASVLAPAKMLHEAIKANESSEKIAQHLSNFKAKTEEFICFANSQEPQS